jgi:hypothetical protein
MFVKAERLNVSFPSPPANTLSVSVILAEPFKSDDAPFLPEIFILAVMLIAI